MNNCHRPGRHVKNRSKRDKCPNIISHSFSPLKTDDKSYLKPFKNMSKIFTKINTIYEGHLTLDRHSCQTVDILINFIDYIDSTKLVLHLVKKNVTQNDYH